MSQYNTLHLAPHHITLRPPHFTLHHSISGIIPNHTTFHVTTFLTISHQFHIAPAHYSTLQYHISNRTISATLCTTPLTSRIAPHFTLQTCRIPCTPRHISFRSHHILATSFMHRTTTSRHFTQHCTAFHMLPILHHSANSISHYHVSHNIPHHRSVHTTFYISHNTTSTTRYRAVSQPTLYLIPHRTTFHIPCHSPHSTSFHIAQRSTFRATAHTPIHITQLSITPF